MFRLQREELISKVDWIALSSTYMCRLTKSGDELKIQSSWSPAAKGPCQDLSSYGQVTLKVDGGDDFDLETDLDRLRKVIKSCVNSDVILKAGPKSIGIQSGSYRYSLKAEAPLIDESRKFLNDKVVLDALGFEKALSKAMVCAAVNDPRHYLCGVNFKKTSSGIDFESTNGYMASIINFDCSPDPAWPASTILPIHNATKLARAVQKLFKLGYDSISFSYNKDYFDVSAGDYALSMFVLQGDFPDISRFFGGESLAKVSIKGMAAREALSAASAVHDEFLVDVILENKQFYLYSGIDNNEYFDCFIDCETDNDVKSKFSTSFVRDLVNTMEDGRVGVIEFCFVGEAIDKEVQRVILSGKSTETERYLVMPMRR